MKTTTHTQSSTPHRAAVITAFRVWYGDGTNRMVLPSLCRDLPHIMRGLDRFADHATIVITGVTPADFEGQSEPLRAAGWEHSRIDAWTLFHRKDGRTAAVGLRDAMTPPHLGVLFDMHTEPGELARLLDRYYDATGTAWRGTCATTALNAIRLTWGNTRYQPRWVHDKIGVRSSAGPLSWIRPLNEVEASGGYVHTFDANAAYLGSAITAELAFERLHHVGPQLFDQTLPGYWCIDLHPTTLEMIRQPGRPPLLGKVVGNAVWVTTPIARLLWDLGDRCEVVDSWTARAEQRDNGRRLHPAGSRVLRTWGEGIRDSLDGAHPSVLHAVKRTYKDAVGGMQREGMRIYRPDWGHTIIDWWRATLYRKILHVHDHCVNSQWPVRVATDSISYAWPWADGRALGEALGLRPGLGGYKHEETVTVEQWQSRKRGAATR